MRSSELLWHFDLSSRAATYEYLSLLAATQEYPSLLAATHEYHRHSKTIYFDTCLGEACSNNTGCTYGGHGDTLARKIQPGASHDVFGDILEVGLPLNTLLDKATVACQKIEE